MPAPVMNPFVRKFRFCQKIPAIFETRCSQQGYRAVTKGNGRHSQKSGHFEHLRGWARSGRCLKRSKFQNESVEARPCRYWGPLDYHCHSQAPRPQSLVGWEICQPQRPEMTIESLSVRKTSAWRRSTPSTRKAKAQESLSVKRRFRTSAWRRSTSSTKKPKAQLSQT
jgi:hypothetical protein